MRKRKLPGQSILAQKAHFLKGGPMEPGKAARNRRKRKSNHLAGASRRAGRGRRVIALKYPDDQTGKNKFGILLVIRAVRVL